MALSKKYIRICDLDRYFYRCRKPLPPSFRQQPRAIADLKTGVANLTIAFAFVVLAIADPRNGIANLTVAVAFAAFADTKPGIGVANFTMAIAFVALVIADPQRAIAQHRFCLKLPPVYEGDRAMASPWN
ncbi:MAG: hypothetical protein ACFB8W_11815 [Elainellaceae cyanobacterium]